MANSVGTIGIDLDLNNAGFKKSLSSIQGQAQQASKNVKKHFEDTAKSIESSIKDKIVGSLANMENEAKVPITNITNKIREAFSELNAKISDTCNELKSIDNLLELDPNSTILLTQKQEVLGQAVENSRRKLEALKATQRQVYDDFKSGKISGGDFRDYQRQFIEAEQGLSNAESALQKFRNSSKSATEETAEGVAETTEGVKDLDKSFSNVGTTVGGIVGVVILVLEKISEKIEETIQTINNVIKAFVKTTSNIIGAGLKVAGEYTLKQFLGIFDNPIIQNAISMLREVFDWSNILDFSKESIELGSDLAEVQNVVDVTFSSMSNDVNEFAKNAADSFGLSETMAKRYAGTLGAMAKAFGFSESEAYQMSTALTGLAGDVASFYNISQDEAYTKLKSVFTGETETLKDLGVVMTQTALDAYAMANGYGKTTKEMTEAEKVALRYAFVQNQLSAAQGDFARTANSWANQIRQLNLQWQVFMAKIGDSIIKVLTPLVKILNDIVSALQFLADWIGTIINAIFGDDANKISGFISENMASSADETADLALFADEAAKSLNDVAAATDKIYDKLANYDELNVLGQESPLENSDTSDVVNQALSSLNAIPNAVKTAMKKANNEIRRNDFVDAIISNIKKGNWYNVGYLLTSKLSEQLTKIPWAEIQISARNLAKNIGDFINGAIAGLDWELVGKTIAEGLKTAIIFLLTLIKEIKWDELGKGLGEAIKGLIVNFPAKELGELLAEKINAAFKFVSGLVSEIPWGELGEKIAESLASYFKTLNLAEEKNGDSIPKTIAELLNGLIDAGIKLFNYRDPETGEGIGEVIGRKIGEGIQEFINNFQFKDAVKFVKDGIHSLVTLIYTAFSKIEFSDAGKQLGEGANEWFKDKKWWADVGRMVNEICNKIIDLLTAFFTTIDTFELTNSLLILIGNINFDQIGNKLWTGLLQAIASQLLKWKERLSAVFKYATQNGSEDGITDGINNAQPKIKESAGKAWDGIKSSFGGVGTWFEGTFGDAWSRVKNIFKDKKGIGNISMSVQTSFKEIINKLIDGINNVLTIPFDGLKNAMNILKNWEIAGIKPFQWLPEITTPLIPKLASGGLVTAPTLALVGDNRGAGAGNPEVVAPLNRLQGMINSGRENGDSEQVVAILLKIYELLLMFIDGGGNIYEFTAELNGDPIFKEMIRQNNIYKKRHGGHSAFEGV